MCKSTNNIMLKNLFKLTSIAAMVLYILANAPNASAEALKFEGFLFEITSNSSSVDYPGKAVLSGIYDKKLLIKYRHIKETNGNGEYYDQLTVPVFVEGSDPKYGRHTKYKVTGIADYAFQNENIGEVYFLVPDNVPYHIGKYAFAGAQLRVADFPIKEGSPITIDEYAFANCHKLWRVDTRGVEQICDYAFSNCENIRHIELEYQLNGIGHKVFDILDNAYIYTTISNPPTIFDDTFSETDYSNSILFAPNSSIEKYKNSTGWKNFKYILPTFAYIDGSRPIKLFDKTVLKGEVFEPTAEIINASGRPNGYLVEYKSNDPSIVTIKDGKLIAVGVGQTEITATFNKRYTGTCKITVEPCVENIVIDFTSMGITGNSLDMYIGDQKPVEVLIEPQEAKDKTLTWSSANPEIASIDDEGIITAIKLGTTEISVSATSGASAHLKVNVVQSEVESIILNPTGLELYISESKNIEATVLPETAKDKTIRWKSEDESVAIVDENGKVTALSAGETVITATSSSGVKATATVKAIPIEATSISLYPTEISLKVSEKSKLNVSFTPVNTTDKTIKWSSSDETVATVDMDGEITAHSLGQTSISATTTNGKTANCMVTVISTSPALISLDKNSAILRAKETVQLTASILPETTTNKFVFWESDATNIAKVNENGLVTAVSIGEATITATTINGLSATCKINVIPTIATDLSLIPSQIELHIGEDYQVEAKLIPETTTDKTLEWTSSNSHIATVDQTGLVKALSIGTTRIIASTTDGSGLTAICFLTVNPVPVESIILNQTEWKGIAGDTFQLTATILPENATNKTISWESNNQAVATVDESGLIKAIKAGTATISATAIDESGISATCEVIVDENSIITDIEIGPNEKVKIYTLQGVLIFEGDFSKSKISRGTYLITTQNQCFKYFKK